MGIISIFFSLNSEILKTLKENPLRSFFTTKTKIQTAYQSEVYGGATLYRGISLCFSPPPVIKCFSNGHIVSSLMYSQLNSV